MVVLVMVMIEGGDDGGVGLFEGSYGRRCTTRA